VFFIGDLLYYWLFNRDFLFWVVTCEGGKPYLGLISLLPLQNHRSLGTSPLGLTSLKRKNLPIVVTLGGIGSCYVSLAFNLIVFFLGTNCAITMTKLVMIMSLDFISLTSYLKIPLIASIVVVFALIPLILLACHSIILLLCFSKSLFPISSFDLQFRGKSLHQSFIC